MSGGIRFLIFIAVLVVLIFYKLVNFWTLIILGTMIFLAAIIIFARNLWFRSHIGWLGFEVGSNNNYRLFFLIGVTLCFFVLSLKYGAGEPLLLTTFRGTAEIAKPYYHENEDAQKTKNRWLYGENKANSEIKTEQAWLKSYSMEKIYPLKEKTENETSQTYNEKIKNYMVYGVFADNEVLEKKLSQMPKGWTSKQALENKPVRKTWFFWQMTILFALLSICYIPFAFSDEAANFFRGLAERISKKQAEQLRSQLPPLVTTAPAGTTAAVAVPFAGMSLLKKLSLIFTSDMAAEVAIRVLGKLADFFSSR